MLFTMFSLCPKANSVHPFPPIYTAHFYEYTICYFYLGMSETKITKHESAKEKQASNNF